MKLSDIDFKYTLSKERIKWCKTVYPVIHNLFNRISSIQCNNFNINEICEITILDESSSIINTKMANVRVKPNTMMLYLAGGSVYEVLQQKYNNVKLRDYVDPTGDLDIFVQVPIIELTEDMNTDNDIIIKLFNRDQTTINAYYLNLMHWLYDELHNILNTENLLSGFEKFDSSEFDEVGSNSGFRNTEIGNCRLVCFVTENLQMLKIQLTGKVGNIIDHIVEIVIPVMSDSNNVIATDNGTLRSKEQTMNINNIHIQTFGQLVSDNIVAYFERKRNVEHIIEMLNLVNLNELPFSSHDIDEIQNHIHVSENYIHKSTNHIGRLLYIFELFKNEPELRKNKIMKNDIISYLNNEFSNIENMATAYNIPITMQHTAYGDIPKISDYNRQKIYDIAYIYYYRINKRGKYSIIKIKINTILANYSDVFKLNDYSYPFKIMNIQVVPKITNLNKLILKNNVLHSVKYYDSRVSNKTRKRKTNNYSA